MFARGGMLEMIRAMTRMNNINSNEETEEVGEDYGDVYDDDDDDDDDVYDDDDDDEEEVLSLPQNNANNQGKTYQWSIQDGNELLALNNDFVLEAHYTQPGAYGITLNTSKYGNLFLDFDKMSIPGTQLRLLRQTFLPSGQKEVNGWYYLDNRCWYEYGCPNSMNLQASMGSDQIEQYYQEGSSSFQFTVGQFSYTLDFNTMLQTNDSTLAQRQVRRRPKFQPDVQNQAASMPPTSPSNPKWIWQFDGEEGWTNYENNRAHGCSITSDDIEQNYQQNPQMSMNFSVGRYTYILDFTTMSQTNQKFGTVRKVRRLNATDNVNSGQQTNTQKSQYTWQFKGEEDQWTDYQYKNTRRVRCTVSSAEIENNYRQNPQGSMGFSTNRFTYILDFTRMVQTNQQTGTEREIRRIKKSNHAANNGFIWQFLGEENTWTEYKTELRCSVTSANIEQSYQNDPTGSMTFTAGHFTYHLDFSAMMQTNQSTQKRRQVRRIQQLL